MKLHKLLLIVAVSAALSSCASSKPKPIKEFTGTDTANASVELAETAVSVSDSLRNLAQVEEAATPKTKLIPPEDPAKYGMAGIASVDWAGPIEPLVRKIAQSTGYKLKVLGPAPATPVMVLINAKNEALGDILRDAGYQGGKQANVIVFPKRKIIELRYART